MKKLVGIVECSYGYEGMMKDMGFDVVAIDSVHDVCKDVIEQCDLIMFTGGADVNPHMYGQVKHPRTFCNDAYDDLCDKVYDIAIELQKPLVGICRGSQYLCVKAGGELYQDVGGHASTMGHMITDKFDNTYHVTSTHHQMMKLDNATCEFELVAHASLDCFKEYMQPLGTPEDEQKPIGETVWAPDPEVVFFPEINALAVQFHPEMGFAYDSLEAFQVYMNKYIAPLM